MEARFKSGVMNENSPKERIVHTLFLIGCPKLYTQWDLVASGQIVQMVLGKD